MTGYKELAERGIAIAEESLAEAKRQNAEVVRLLKILVSAQVPVVISHS